jgi:hypothetical protein
MISAIPPEYEEIAKEINANFSVIESTLHTLKSDLVFDKFCTSYAFISENIKYVSSYIRDELENILSKARSFCDVWVSSPLQMLSYKQNPEVIFEYRDIIRKFSGNVREIVANLYINVNKTLAAYILTYETLEKFGFKVPFVFVESTEFFNESLIDFVFGEFKGVGPEVAHKPTKAQVITYSGIDISDPLSLLIIGHEIFHIIDRLDGVFDDYCENTGFQRDKRSNDAFVDILSALYFGPIYVYAMQKHFEKRYPLSGGSHMEMNARLLASAYLISVLKIGSSQNQINSLNNFIKVLENRMDAGAKVSAQKDKEKIDAMLQKGVIGYIKNYFKKKMVTTYDDFLNIIEKREFNSSIEKIDRKKIQFMLHEGIPVAVRPTTLLNALYESGDLDKVEMRLIMASFKKWYVRRYYEKICEKIRRTETVNL